MFDFGIFHLFHLTVFYLLCPNSSTINFFLTIFISPGTSHEYAGRYHENNLSVLGPSKGRWGAKPANGTLQYGDLEQSVSHPQPYSCHILERTQKKDLHKNLACCSNSWLAFGLTSGLERELMFKPSSFKCRLDSHWP